MLQPYLRAVETRGETALVYFDGQFSHAIGKAALLQADTPAAPIPYANGHITAREADLKDRVVAMMLDGVLKPGDALPSVRQVAAEYQLNPITVSRAYQELADEQLVEKRRGLGMYVTEGANARLLQSERERFLREEWPLVMERIQRLGLSIQELLEPQQKWAPK